MSRRWGDFKLHGFVVGRLITRPVRIGECFG